MAAPVRVAIYEPDGLTFITNVPRRRNVKWQDEVNTAGSAGFDIPLDDPLLVTFPNLLDDYNIVKFYVGDNPVKSWIIESKQPVQAAQGEGADRWVTLTGRGLVAALEAVIVYPEYDLTETTSEDRHFNYASLDGEWRITSEWAIPTGVKWSDSTQWAHTPPHWPDPDAYWVWYGGAGGALRPEDNHAPGTNWFRAIFTTTVRQDVRVYATADNQLDAVYIDGEVVLSSGPSTKTAYKKSYFFDVFGLGPGVHTLAAAVNNLSDTGGSVNTPAGFICTIFRLDGAGKPTTDNVFRSVPGEFVVKPYGSVPGWNGASILKQLIVEAQDRNVDSVTGMTFDFDNVNDSNGVPWDDIQDRAVKIATTDLFDIATQLIELTLDLDIDADLVVHAYRKRGTDRSATVRILPAHDAIATTAQTQAARVRNQVLVKFDGGWIELFAAASKDAYGRREAGLSLGTSASVGQTVLVGTAAIQEVAQPDTTITVSNTNLAGPQPYVDYYLGDTILTPNALPIPGQYINMEKSRVMSITGSEQGEGTIQWDLEFYPDTDEEDVTVSIATGGSYDATSALYRSEVMSDSPWGYWRLLESSGTHLNDESGHNYDLTLLIPHLGSPTLASGGPLDTSITFDQVSGSTSDSWGLTHGRTSLSSIKKLWNYKAITLEAWVYVVNRPSSGNHVALLTMEETFTHTTNFELRIAGGGRVSWIYSGSGHGGTSTLTSTDPLTLNTWYHVVGSTGSTGSKLYINGTMDQHDAVVPAIVKSDFGYNALLRAPEDPYSVRLAEPAVYAQQLLNSRILSHWRAANIT